MQESTGVRACPAPVHLSPHAQTPGAPCFAPHHATSPTYSYPAIPSRPAPAPADVSYGPKSSGELLLSYGFCPPPAANPHQDYKLLVGVNDSAAADPLAALKAEVLAKHGACRRRAGYVVALRQVLAKRFVNRVWLFVRLCLRRVRASSRERLMAPFLSLSSVRQGGAYRTHLTATFLCLPSCVLTH